MKRSQFVATIAALVASIAAGCGSTASTANNQPPPTAGVTVTLSPSSATVQVGGVQQFTATVSPSGANQAVTWSVSGTGCTGASCGTIDATGKYAAPATLPNPPTVTVTARSVADSTKAATAAGTIISISAPSAFSLNPTSLAFGNQAINTTSAPRTVTLTNTSTAPAPFDFLQIMGPTDFAQTNNCPLTIAAGTSCTFIVTFKPTTIGDRMADLVFENLNLFVHLTGTGTAGTTTGRPTSVAVAPDPSGQFGKFVYVANSGSDTISMFTIDAATGALTSAGTIAAGTDPGSVAVHPSGKFIYVVNTGSNNVSMYAIEAATGVLTSTGTVPAAVNPWSVTVHTSGKFAYVANAGSNSVSMYAIDAATGVLTSTGTVAAGTRPDSVAVDPSGKFAYVANSISADVSMYTIDAATGSLTPTGPVAAGTAVSVAVHPSGNFAYVAGCGDVVSISEISMYNINDATGTLTPIGRIDAGACPFSVAVHPSGRFAYVADLGDEFRFSDRVLMYTINGSTGELTSIGIIHAGPFPIAVAIDPSGKFAYVVNWGSNDISMYTVDPTTGALTLIGTIGT
jgi:YVTN family beta-propeller protein